MPNASKATRPAASQSDAKQSEKSEKKRANGGRRKEAPPPPTPHPRTLPPAGLPADVAEFIGERPIVQGEDPDAYDALFSRIWLTVKPIDAIEWIWSKEIADATWQARRIRRVANRYLHDGSSQSLLKVMKRLLKETPLDKATSNESAASRLVAQWEEMGAEGAACVAEFLAAAGVDPSALVAESHLSRQELLEQLERSAAAIDRRRDRLIAEIERRRAGRGYRFREATDIVDAEAEEIVDPKSSRDSSGTD